MVDLTKLDELITEAMSAGVSVDELVVRVAQYDKDCRTPLSFQAIARFQNRTKPWGVGIHADPVEAAKRALMVALDVPKPAAPVVPPRVRARVRPGA